MRTADVIAAFASWFVGRTSDYAWQRADGRYVRAGAALSLEVLASHLAGAYTVGTYLADEDGLCRCAVFDDDRVHGLLSLAEVQRQLVAAGWPALLESSRRGGHLWLSFLRPVPAWWVRQQFLPFCPPGVEFYPKQDTLSGAGYGSLIRLPLGVHQRTGQRYPFMTMQDGQLVALPDDLATVLAWLEVQGRCAVPWSLPVQTPTAALPRDQRAARKHHTSQTKSAGVYTGSPIGSIRNWCAAQDPFTLLGRYVALDGRGMGCCPFGSHHSDGVDQHPSFRVYAPSSPGGWCWYCYTWDTGGNVFNFLQLYYGLDARTLWSRILSGERF